MSIIAKQSTARTVMVGPILDEDGVAVTDAAVGDLKISKNGAAPAALNGSATLTHRNTGHYSLALTASDCDTVGSAQVVIDDTTNAMPPLAITVIEEAVYDALYGASATGLLPANVTQIAGNGTNATNLGTAASNYSATRGLAGTALPAAAADAAGGLVISDAGGLDIDAKLANTNEITTARMGALTDWTNGGRLDNIIDAILADTAVIGTPAGVSIAADMVAIAEDTDAIEGRLTADRAGYLDNLNGHTAQTGDSFARIGANGAGLTAVPWNSAWDAEVQSECADALAAYNVVATTDLPTNFGSLGINGSGHVSRVTLTDTTTTNTDMRGTDSAYTGTPPTAAAIRSEIDSNSTQLAAIKADTNDLQTNQGDWLTATGFSTLTTGDIDARLAAYDPPTKAELDAAVAGLNDLSAAQVNAEVDTAIETYHLDHLLAAAYDPTSKPGNASGLLNVIFESDGGVPRYTANALEQGPSGGGGSADWTDGEKEQIRYRLQLDGDQTEPTDTDLPEVNVKQVNGTAVSLSNITFTINNSVDSGGTIKVRRGTDYSPTIGTQLDVIKSGYASGAFSSGASGTFRYRQADGSLVTAGSVSISQSGDTVTATITLTDTEIDAMVANKAGTWECDITSSGGLIADHGKGKLIVTDKVA